MYGIEARFPLSEMKNLEIENGTIEYKAIMDYDNPIYSQYKLMQDKITLVFGDLILIPLFALIPYVLFYWTPKEWKKVNGKIKEE